ncbi:general stress protein [Paenibacillus campi]|uniref:general stress protein n=1 Tax=Paenibacillus campi TaxID=3106031 RepID=UPI002AFF0465|nr:general stress protein [Paenibacillus sp. SGZ-1014]
MLNNGHNRNELDNDTRKIVGVFTTEEQASQAIRDLKDAGFASDDISIVGNNKADMRQLGDETGTKAPEGVATGATTGGVIGGVAGLLAGLGLAAIPVFGPIMAAGPIAVTLAGAAAGAGAGGLVGGLIGMGIPEEEAREYEANVNEGNILVMVDSAAGNRSRIYDVFRANGATNSRYYDAPLSTSVNGETAHPATEHVSGVYTTEESQQRIVDREQRLADEDTGTLGTTATNAPLSERDVRAEQGLGATNDMDVTHDEQRVDRSGQPTIGDASAQRAGMGTNGALGANMANTGSLDPMDHERRRTDDTHDESLKEKGKDLIDKGKEQIDRMRR